MNTAETTSTSLSLKPDASQEVHLGGRIRRPFRQILFLEAEFNYTHIYLRTGEHFIVATTLKELEGRLQDYGFWRCHKSHMVNLAWAQIEPQEGKVRFKGFKPIDISRRRTRELKKVLQFQEEELLVP